MLLRPSHDMSMTTLRRHYLELLCFVLSSYGPCYLMVELMLATLRVFSWHHDHVPFSFCVTFLHMHALFVLAAYCFGARTRASILYDGCITVDRTLIFNPHFLLQL